MRWLLSVTVAVYAAHIVTLWWLGAWGLAVALVGGSLLAWWSERPTVAGWLRWLWTGRRFDDDRAGH